MDRRVITFHLHLALVVILCGLCGGVGEVYADEDNASWWWPFDGAEHQEPRVQIVEAFINWRTGPAQGYPVFHVSEKGEWLTVLKRKTDWIKVRDIDAREGWIHIDDFIQTKDETERLVSITEPRFDDFNTRRWEGGFAFGEFDSTALNSGYIGYWFTENIATELWGTQILGNASEIRLFSLNALLQPFPNLRVSPFFTLGAGVLYVDPKATLVQTNDREEETLLAGIGLRYYMTERYFLRMEVKDYKVFTDRDTDEEATEWKIGLSVFF